MLYTEREGEQSAPSQTLVARLWQELTLTTSVLVKSETAKYC